MLNLVKTVNMTNTLLDNNPRDVVQLPSQSRIAIDYIEAKLGKVNEVRIDVDRGYGPITYTAHASRRVA